MEPVLSLLALAFVPISASLVLYFFFKSEKGKNLSYVTKQIIAGILFGLVSICGTEFGVPFNGAIINIRDTGPLCAGLIFGGPAGIIAGLIGGVERWLAVYWGAGSYTRLACTISTILIGLICFLLKKYIYEDRIPGSFHGFIVGVICEVIHMLMIFVTNMDDTKVAFGYVEACTLPMVIINSFAIGFSIYLIENIARPQRYRERQVPHLSTLFQKILIWVVLVGFVSSVGFGSLLQKRLSNKNTADLLRLNIQDVVNDLKDQSNEALLSINRLVVKEIEDNPDYNLEALKKKYNIAEIDLIGKDGVIYDSSEQENIGFDMSSGEQSKEFMILLGITKEFAQEFMPSSRDATILRKYSGVKTDNGFIQVAYGQEEFNKDMAHRLSNIVKHRHIGETGNMLVIDSNGQLISTSTDTAGSNYDIELNEEDTLEYTKYVGKINGEKFYYMFTDAEGYRIYATIPGAEADFSEKLSTYLTQFLQIIVFGTLFAAIYFVIKSLVVDNIVSVNRSLSNITDGELDTVVDVSSSKEFISLSDGINTTVDSLKHFIEEANTRIDNELKYAAQIQESALPSTFPAFPSRDEFDIYALMDPAKEVGGDFYDFYMVDKKTIVFLVADVAGKGIPASLFMMRAKTILKTYAENNIDVADIFTNANFQLCEGNDAGMFVTAWMGFLNLETGQLKYANAGHNRPLIRRKDGNFEYLQGPAGFVLAGMEGITYKEQSITLYPGDEIFLYTDGVVEATNVDKKLYGDDRLEICANKSIGLDSKQLCEKIKEDVDKFYEGADQFDDITELSLQFKKYYVANSDE